MFYDRLRALCKERGTSLTAVLKELGLSTGSTGSWKKGLKYMIVSVLFVAALDICTHHNRCLHIHSDML